MPAVDEPQQLSPWPFAIALGLAVTAAIAAFAFLREDPELRTVRPDSLRLVDDRTVDASFRDDDCLTVERAQVDLTDDDLVFVELVARVDADGCTGPGHRLTVVLPDDVGDRGLVAGAGRTELPCDPDGRCESAG